VDPDLDIGDNVLFGKAFLVSGFEVKEALLVGKE
jgi:hypothetical protein